MEIVPHELVKNAHANVVEAFQSSHFVEQVVDFEEFTVAADLDGSEFVQVFLNFNLRKVDEAGEKANRRGLVDQVRTQV